MLAFWFIVAAAVAALLRLKDYPDTKLDKDNVKSIILTFVGALIAAIVGWKLLGVELIVDGAVQTEELILIMSIAIGGMTTLRATLLRFKPLEKLLG